MECLFFFFADFVLKLFKMVRVTGRISGEKKGTEQFLNQLEG